MGFLTVFNKGILKLVSHFSCDQLLTNIVFRCVSAFSCPITSFGLANEGLRECCLEGRRKGVHTLLCASVPVNISGWKVWYIYGMVCIWYIYWKDLMSEFSF